MLIRPDGCSVLGQRGGRSLSGRRLAIHTGPLWTQNPKKNLPL